jgi:hypothetical protein
MPVKHDKATLYTIYCAILKFWTTDLYNTVFYIRKIVFYKLKVKRQLEKINLLFNIRTVISELSVRLNLAMREIINIAANLY